MNRPQHDHGAMPCSPVAFEGLAKSEWTFGGITAPQPRKTLSYTEWERRDRAFGRSMVEN